MASSTFQGEGREGFEIYFSISSKSIIDKTIAEGLCSQYVETTCPFSHTAVPENPLVRAWVHRDAVRGTVLPFSSDLQRLYVRGHRALWCRARKFFGAEAYFSLSSVE